MMKNAMKVGGLLVIAFSLLSLQSARAYSSPGTPSGFVNDFAHVLSVEEKNTLEETLRAYTASTSNEIAVVTVKDLGGDYIENYAVKLFEEWKIGKKSRDNGVLLLVAMDDRKMRIEVGYGLEGALPDAISSAIIRNDITPAFKEGNYYRGITNGVTSIIEATKGEYTGDTTSTDVSGATIEHAIFFVFIAFQFLAAVLGRSKSWWAGGVLGAIIGALVTFFGVLGITLGVGVVITIILTILGLIFDYIVSSAYTRAVSRGGSIPWWVGGSGGGSGGASFGGFGGGRSGGGGASGSW
jgi:uncharacterized protein